MNETTIEEIEKEIDEKTKLPKDIKDKITKEIFTNIVMAISVIIYFTFLILGSVGTVKNIRIIDFNIFSIILLGISILLFEIAWRKDSGKLAMHGIEMLAIALFTLFLPYIIFELASPYQKFYLIASAYTTVYYSIKSIYIAIKSRKKYMVTVTDIKDIVKKEKSKKTVKEDVEETEEIETVEEEDVKEELSIKVEEFASSKQKTKKGEKPKKQEIKNKEDKPKETKKKKNEIKEDTIKSEKTKKAGRTKKTETLNVQENVVNKETLKKRGRPKKSETPKEESVVQKEETPKKRGRPRKVVTND